MAGKGPDDVTSSFVIDATATIEQLEQVGKQLRENEAAARSMIKTVRDLDAKAGAALQRYSTTLAVRGPERYVKDPETGKRVSIPGELLGYQRVVHDPGKYNRMALAQAREQSNYDLAARNAAIELEKIGTPEAIAAAEALNPAIQKDKLQQQTAINRAKAIKKGYVTRRQAEQLLFSRTEFQRGIAGRVSKLGTAEQAAYGNIADVSAQAAQAIEVGRYARAVSILADTELEYNRTKKDLTKAVREQLAAEKDASNKKKQQERKDEAEKKRDADKAQRDAERKKREEDAKVERDAKKKGREDDKKQKEELNREAKEAERKERMFKREQEKVFFDKRWRDYRENDKEERRARREAMRQEEKGGGLASYIGKAGTVSALTTVGRGLYSAAEGLIAGSPMAVGTGLIDILQGAARGYARMKAAEYVSSRRRARRRKGGGGGDAVSGGGGPMPGGGGGGGPVPDAVRDVWASVVEGEAMAAEEAAAMSLPYNEPGAVSSTHWSQRMASAHRYRRYERQAAEAAAFRGPPGTVNLPWWGSNAPPIYLPHGLPPRPPPAPSGPIPYLQFLYQQTYGAPSAAAALHPSAMPRPLRLPPPPPTINMQPGPGGTYLPVIASPVVAGAGGPPIPPAGTAAAAAAGGGGGGGMFGGALTGLMSGGLGGMVIGGLVAGTLGLIKSAAQRGFKITEDATNRAADMNEALGRVLLNSPILGRERDQAVGIPSVAGLDFSGTARLRDELYFQNSRQRFSNYLSRPGLGMTGAEITKSLSQLAGAGVTITGDTMGIAQTIEVARRRNLSMDAVAAMTSAVGRRAGTIKPRFSIELAALAETARTAGLVGPGASEFIMSMMGMATTSAQSGLGFNISAEREFARSVGLGGVSGANLTNMSTGFLGARVGAMGDINAGFTDMAKGLAIVQASRGAKSLGDLRRNLSKMTSADQAAMLSTLPMGIQEGVASVFGLSPEGIELYKNRPTTDEKSFLDRLEKAQGQDYGYAPKGELSTATYALRETEAAADARRIQYEEFSYQKKAAERLTAVMDDLTTAFSNMLKRLNPYYVPTHSTYSSNNDFKE